MIWLLHQPQKGVQNIFSHKNYHHVLFWVVQSSMYLQKHPLYVSLISLHANHLLMTANPCRDFSSAFDILNFPIVTTLPGLSHHIAWPKMIALLSYCDSFSQWSIGLQSFHTQLFTGLSMIGWILQLKCSIRWWNALWDKDMFYEMR